MSVGIEWLRAVRAAEARATEGWALKYSHELRAWVWTPA